MPNAGAANATTVHDAHRHVLLLDTHWDEDAAQRAVERIAADTLAAFRGHALWPVHPVDRSLDRPADCLKPLFNGAGGVFWALRRLRAQGAGVAALDDVPFIAQLPARQHEDDASLGHPTNPAFAVGAAGLQLLAWMDEPDADRAAALEDAIDSCAARAELGFALGAAGGLLAASFAYARSGGERWRTSILRIADALWLQWTDVPALGGHHWLQNLYGHSARQLGALHGLAGITFALARAFSCTGDARLHELAARTRRVLLGTARRDGVHANWPLAVGNTTHPSPDVLWLQHCIGAPGVISCAAWVPAGDDPAFDALLLGAGELVWHAGPTSKLPSLCHGAPGSGYAFLALFRRTGDERWLERARRFGMHAIEHADRAAREHGQRKYSLWTGDLGLALYLQDCVGGVARLPLLDVF